MGDSPSSQDPNYIDPSETADLRLAEFSNNCRSAIGELEEIILESDGTTINRDHMSDLLIMAGAVAAHELAQVLDETSGQRMLAIIDGTGLHPTLVFFGLGLKLLEANPDMLPPELRNVYDYLAKRHKWDLGKLQGETFAPGLSYFAHYSENPWPQRQPDLEDSLKELCNDICLLAQDVYKKLLENGYEPIGEASKELWDKVRRFMRQQRLEQTADSDDSPLPFSDHMEALHYRPDYSSHPDKWDKNSG